MKNRILQIIIPIFVFLIFPFNVNAGSLSISISCPDTTVGKTTTCKIQASAIGTEVSGFMANYKLNGATFSSFTPGTGWLGEGTDGKIELYTDTNKSGSFQIGTIVLTATTEGRGSISLTNIGASDADFNEIGGIANASKSFMINKVATTTKKPTTKKTTTTTTTKKKTTLATVSTTKNTIKTLSTTSTIPTQNPQLTTNPITSPENPTLTTTQYPLNLIALSSVTVTETKGGVTTDFPVEFKDGIYYATVNPDTKEVTVGATAATDVMIIGTGVREVVEGENTVDFIVRNTAGKSGLARLVITRPSGNYVMQLSDLKVVGYDLKFDPTKTNYSVSVPFNIKEVYVIATSSNPDFVITGGGLQTLTSGKKEVRVLVSYGQGRSQEYVVTIKKSYGLLFMWIVIGGLGIGMIALYLSMKKNQTAALSKVTADINKQKAAENRQIAAQGPGLALNGEKSTGIGKRMIAPTPVQSVAVATQPETQAPTTAQQPAPQVQTAAPATPQPTVVVKKAPVQMVASAPQAQVKVVKVASTTPQQVDTQAPQNTGAYKNDEIVIKDL